MWREDNVEEEEVEEIIDYEDEIDYYNSAIIMRSYRVDDVIYLNEAIQDNKDTIGDETIQMSYESITSGINNLEG